MNRQREEELLNMFHGRAPISRYFGMRLTFTKDGSAVVDLPHNPNLDHALGGVHGGVYATMLDTAGWFTVALARNDPSRIVTSEITVRYLEPVEKMSLRAIGKIIRQGTRQDIAEMQLLDEEGRLVGHATGAFMVLPKNPTASKDVAG
ncbi:MAG TPA: PaaI family thioesterase [Anaerolineae bacterium]|nr:PaaI family thioesterase [Anaerolineae bacterium]